MAQKDVSGHPEEKHALHNDGPQRSGGRPQEMQRKIRPWHETSYQKEMACQTPLRDLMQEEEMAVINTFQVGEATSSLQHKRNLDSHRLHCFFRGNVGAVELVSSLGREPGIRLQMRRSTRRHDHSPVIAVFLKETEQKKKRENSQRGL